jgi:N-acyl-D-amino-acid deacylase
LVLDLLIKGGTLIDGTGAPAKVADVAVKNGLITSVGSINEPATRVIDAGGLHVTPGFIDIHTHYDGQATWDSSLDPSFSAGVTTAIMGNCGVGFAPVHKGDEEKLIDLMEGVEEIPGTALHAGMKWNWNTFPEYLAVLDQPRTFDLGALVPHGPLRRFVMGDKVGTDKCASDEELRTMCRLTDEAMQAGAFGLSSSRTPLHRTVTGRMTDDFDVDEPELRALAAVVARQGGYMELIPLGSLGDGREELAREMQMYDRIMRDTGVDLHVLTVQTPAYPEYCFEQIRWAEATQNGKGGKAFAQVAGRMSAILLSVFGMSPFMDRGTMLRTKKDLPESGWLAELAKSEIKARILAERSPAGGFGDFMSRYIGTCYDLGPEFDFEPDSGRNVAEIAKAAGSPAEDVLYDLMLATSENPRVMIVLNNYVGGNYDDLGKVLQSPAAVLSLSDAGAHVRSICDGSLPVFMLTHWARDRRRGEKLPVERVVKMLTSIPASSVGLHDRGVLAPGKKADINIFDFAALKLSSPNFVHDLPAGAKRLLQSVTGFKATLVSGVLTREDDRPTGALPGCLLRHKQNEAAQRSVRH